jgi:transglutaminase-like putative cysteine protease/tetratricopeptide (TPR) repeat protein
MRTQALERSITLSSIVATFIATIILSAAPRVVAQTTAPSPSKPATAATNYAEESIVIERADSVYTFAADGTGTHERTVVARIQSDAAARSLGIVAVGYAGNSQQVEFLYARVRRPDGTVVETPPADALDMPAAVTREAPFYSDLKEKQLPIRSLRVGDTLEWKARITTTKAEAPGQFWGQESFVEDAVVLSENLELRVPASMSVNVWSPTAKPTETVANGQHIYQWTSSQLKPTAGKQADEDAEAKKKQVWTADQELDTEQGKLPTVAWTTFKSWEEVGAWYHTLEADRITPSPEIKAKVAELIAGKTTDEDKVRAIYSYVATQIRYIGVAFGIGRYQPHTAAEILANQYGDCKDKHTLLAAMLSAAGISSDAVLIGAGVRFNPAVPSPAAFNHVITRVTLAATTGKPAQPIWLDTTTEVAPYRMLVSVIRDRQALAIPATGAAHLDRTPANPPFPTFQTLEAVGSLDKEGTSHSRLTFTIRGDTELIVRSAFHRTSPGQYNQVLQQISYGIGYAGTTSNPDVTSPDDTTAPFKMAYDYQREKAGDWDNLRIIPQIAPVSLPRFADTNPLVRSLDLGSLRVETSKASMKLPEAWEAILPEAVHLKCPYATYDQTYRLDKGTLYTERRVEILKEKVPTTDLKTYKKWANDAALGDEVYIQLVKHDAGTAIHIGSGSKSGAPSSGGPSIVAPGSEEAQELIQKADGLYQAHDFDGLAQVLDQVKAINPDQMYLWSMYGGLAMMQGKTFEAIDDLKKEIKLHADSVGAYLPLAELQRSRGQKHDAINTLRAWTDADPSNPTAAARLMDMLLNEGEAASAFIAGESALAHLPEAAQKDEAFQLVLGHAQIATGEKEKGAATLEALLNSSQNPKILNDTAYVLAVTSLDLPLAEKSSRDALDKYAEETNSVTLDADSQSFRSQRIQIAATWDTLGWVLFREGKFAEAEGYLRAAWISGQNPETSKHLTELASSQGRKPQLNDTHKLTLGPANGRNGDAEYRLLLREGKVVDIKPEGDKTIAGAQDLITKTKLTGFFPPGSQITLMRLGYVNCHSGICELILEP